MGLIPGGDLPVQLVRASPTYELWHHRPFILMLNVMYCRIDSAASLHFLDMVPEELQKELFRQALLGIMSCFDSLSRVSMNLFGVFPIVVACQR